jgi:DNA-binding transcriptional LysR family regulator
MNLDLDTIRTFATIRDLGGYRQAAARIGRTPSAVSLQMKRLQEDVGGILFSRNGRKVELTEAGELVLHLGRQILALNDELLERIRGVSLGGTVRVGFSQDFAETVLSGVLARFGSLYPLIQIEVLIEPNASLADAVERDRLDLALVTGQENRSAAEVLGKIDLLWIARGDFKLQLNQKIPLVLLGPQCTFRERAIKVLEQEKIPWRLAAVSPSVTGIWAATKGKLGLTARSVLGLPPELAFGPNLLGLPSLGSLPITLHGRSDDACEPVQRLRSTIKQCVMNMLGQLKRSNRADYLGTKRSGRKRGGGAITM